MELVAKIRNIVGTKLVEIKKKDSTITLYFESTEHKDVFQFDGLIFESPLSPVNKTVKSAEINNYLGIKALSQLRYENKDPFEYKQLLIQMENKSEEWKTELICVFKKVKITKRTAANRR